MRKKSFRQKLERGERDIALLRRFRKEIAFENAARASRACFESLDFLRDTAKRAFCKPRQDANPFVHLGNFFRRKLRVTSCNNEERVWEFFQEKPNDAPRLLFSLCGYSASVQYADAHIVPRVVFRRNWIHVDLEAGIRKCVGCALAFDLVQAAAKSLEMCEKFFT